MNEVSLSNDLNVITAEIKTWKSFAGMSVWEIGKRIKHVKENNLTHGNYIPWLEEIGMDRSEAYRYTVIADELPNDDTWQHLSSRALYLITTLPEEQKQEQIERINDGHRPTVKEIEKLKKENAELKKQAEQDRSEKEQAKRSEQIAIEQLEREQNKEPEVFEKIIEKEVIPDDYEEMKQQIKSTEAELKSYKDQNEFLEESLQSLYDERSEVDEKSRRYDELNEAIKNAENKLDDNQRMISRYNKLVRMINEVDNVVMKASGFVYTDISEIINQNDAALRDVQNLIYSLERLTDDLKNTLQQGQILEGEIIND